MILKFTFRNLSQRPFLNLIKIVGLSLALTGLLLISLFLKKELTYDRWHKKSERIYRYTYTSEKFFGGKHFARVYNTSYIPQMADYFPEIENYVRLAPIRGGYVKKDEKFIELKQAFQCDSTFLKVFDCELIMGNPENILDEPGSLIVTESFAKKVFGDATPIGQVLSLPKGQFYDEELRFTIRGIMKDFPPNSHFHPDFISTPVQKSIFDSWAWTYVVLAEKADPRSIEARFLDFVSTSLGLDQSELKMVAHLQNIRAIHLHSNKLREIETNGTMTLVYTLSIAAFLLLFIALINYGNLNIGMAGFSDKFMFMNRISGASNRIFLKYYLFEGMIILSSTIVLSFLLSLFTNNMIQKEYGINLFENQMLTVWIIFMLFGILSLAIAASPFYKQVINPANSFVDFKNKNQINRKGLNKSLLVLQYTISIALLAAVLVIHRQTQYAMSHRMGVDTPNLICFENVHTNVQSKFPVFKNELLKHHSIESVSAMFETPGGETNDMFEFEMEDYQMDESSPMDKMIGVFPCDFSFPGIFKLRFLAGSDFSLKEEDHEGAGEYIVNEAAMKKLGYSDPREIIGKKFRLKFNFEGISIPKGSIVGVVKDFHFSSIKKEVEPLVLFKRNKLWISNFIVAFKPELRKEALHDMEEVWNRLFQTYPFQYSDVDAIYKTVYLKERLQSKLLSMFTFIALFICSAGLLGMSLLLTQRRTKEIGIRKVNGATISEIIAMLNWDLLKWIVVSFLISVPLAYYAMHRWLENFAYKINLAWWIFAVAGLIAISVSFFTVSLISWKAARSNPVKALRYE